jgi:hypothetical protein
MKTKLWITGQPDGLYLVASNDKVVQKKLIKNR